MISFALLVAVQAPVPDIDFSKAWDQAQTAIERSYYARESRKAEMEAHLKKWAPVARAAKSKAEFRNAVDSMIAEFKDSHFDMLTDEDQGYYLMDCLLKGTEKGIAMPGIGAWFRRSGDDYTVQMVLDGSPAEKAGLRKGDRMLTVDNKPFSPVLSFVPDVEKKAAVSFARGSQIMQKDVEVLNRPVLAVFLQATRDSAHVIESHGRKFGYVHLWTQANDDFRNALSAAIFGKLSDTDGLILDLRDGFGGRPEGYADPLFRPDVKVGYKFGKTLSVQRFGYGKPVVVLINGGSRSAKEVLSFILKKSHRALLMGSTTAGNVLGTSPNRLNKWAFLEIPIVEVFADGVRLEGVGVSPDIRVPVEADEQGHDLYIARAVEYLQSHR